MNHVAATFAMGLNDPTPAKERNGAAGMRVLVGKRREQTVDFWPASACPASDQSDAARP